MVIGHAKNMTVAKRLKRVVEKSRVFINGQEVFYLSRTKAKRLAYRWRGSRRGKRLAAWLERTKGIQGVTVESPPEYRIPYSAFITNRI